jgi:SAM-dependent methyltransferase
MALFRLRKWLLERTLEPRGARARFRRQWGEFVGQSRGTAGRFALEAADRFPRLDDAVNETPFDAHYLYHTGWAARMLARHRPTRHTDISSSLYFASIASALVPIDFRDYRPARLALPGLECGQADLMALPFADGSLESLSCMHVVEHIGLGRYGDPLDYDGDLKAAAELRRVVAPGGRLLFVVPVGAPRIQFNAHRIYGASQVLGMFAGWELEARALVRDDGSFEEGAPLGTFDAQRYGCGCFCFRRPGTV